MSLTRSRSLTNSPHMFHGIARRTEWSVRPDCGGSREQTCMDAGSPTASQQASCLIVDTRGVGVVAFKTARVIWRRHAPTFDRPRLLQKQVETRLSRPTVFGSLCSSKASCISYVGRGVGVESLQSSLSFSNDIGVVREPEILRNLKSCMQDQDRDPSAVHCLQRIYFPSTLT